jgi:hypothetical protein
MKYSFPRPLSFPHQLPLPLPFPQPAPRCRSPLAAFFAYSVCLLLTPNAANSGLWRQGARIRILKLVSAAAQNSIFLWARGGVGGPPKRSCPITRPTRFHGHDLVRGKRVATIRNRCELALLSGSGRWLADHGPGFSTSRASKWGTRGRRRRRAALGVWQCLAALPVFDWAIAAPHRPHAFLR